ncbi:MAG: hypothetical protein IT374_04620 [Polyangiaceae bacterium]|nr:hypothetical protein [Polyangiaceae bacterium]
MTAARPSPPRGVGLAMRRGILLAAAATALVGVLAGLARVGVTTAALSHAPSHGPLLVLGLFGTVISIERAVALAHPLAYAAPALLAASAGAMLGGLRGAGWLAVAGAGALVGVNAAVVRRQRAPFTWMMLGGALVLTAGAAAWALGRPVAELAPAWMTFFVLTIVAERLELSRLAPTPRWASRALVAVASLVGAASVALAGGVGGAARPLGLGLATLGVWQLRFDLARRTARLPGLPRYSAIGVLAGAGWLTVTGAAWAYWGAPPPAGPRYDALLHGVFVGYVLAMVMAHAPIILPAVARVEVPYHPALWAGPLVLHAGLVVRLVGDAAGDVTVRRAGSIANAAALLVFVAGVVAARALSRARRRGA